MKLDGLLNAALGSPVGKKLTGALGLAEAVELRRGRTVPSGPIVFATVPPQGSSLCSTALASLGVNTIDPLFDTPEARTTGEDGRARPPAYPQPIGAVVIDATALTQVSQLELVREILRPAVKALEASGRVVLVGLDPAGCPEVQTASVQQALDGIMRSVGKELRHGATANLVQLPAATRTQPSAADLAPTLAFFLEGRSAYVSGQLVKLTGPTAGPADPQHSPIVVVTGAARGIGAAIARTFARDGAQVVLVDVPAAGESLAKVANELRGSALQLDITVPDAGARIAAHVAGRYGGQARIDVLVHCAGILRDRLLVNLDEKGWGSVLEVNLAAQLRINDTLLQADLPGGIADGGRIVGVASTSGWAGNRGQTNYAASKAGVMGWVRALAPTLADRGIRVNAVAPGFIETDMTATIPFVEREIFKRSNSLIQAGKPIDVAEAIVFLAEPSNPVNGQVLRVCGQLIVGA